MLAHLVAFPLSVLLLTHTAQAGVAILDTPASLTTCEPTMLHWDDGVSPYYLSVLPGGEPMASPLKTFAPTEGNTLTWLVDLDPGTSVSIALKDSTGAITYAAAATILRGADSSCVDSSTSIGKQILEYPQSTSPPAATPSGLSAESEGGGDIPASETILKDESTVNNSTASAVANASEVVVQDVSPTAAASSDVADASDVSATSSSAVPSASGAILVSRIVSTVIDTASRSQSSALPTGTARVIALTGGALGTQRGVVGWTGAVGLVGAVVLAL